MARRRSRELEGCRLMAQAPAIGPRADGALFAVVLTGSLLLAACGGGGTVSVGAQPASTAEPAAATATPEPTTTVVEPTARPAPTPTPVWDRPDWAAPSMTEDDVERMLTLLDGELGSRSGRVERVDGQLIVDGVSSLDLDTLSSELTALPADEWATAVARYVDVAVATADAGLPPTFEAAAPMLRIRLLATEDLPTEAATVNEEVARGLHAVAVVDFPDSLRYVSPDALELWGVDRELVFATAREAMAEIESELVESVVEQLDEGPVELFTGSFYTASFAEQLDVLIDDVGPNGAWVAAPVSDILLVHEVTNRGSLRLLTGLYRLTGPWYADGPASVSPGIYWWRDGELELLRLLVLPNDEVGLPEDQLSELLESLPE